jgi:hypothetical protein
VFCLFQSKNLCFWSFLRERVSLEVRSSSLGVGKEGGHHKAWFERNSAAELPLLIFYIPRFALCTFGRAPFGCDFIPHDKDFWALTSSSCRARGTNYIPGGEAAIVRAVGGPEKLASQLFTHTCLVRNIPAFTLLGVLACSLYDLSLQAPRL